MTASTTTASRRALRASGANLVQWGRWRLTQLLAEGDLARLHLAQPVDGEQQGGAQYVVKSLRSEWGENSHAARMFMNEAAAGRAATHPHLAPVLDLELCATPWFIVLPWLAGDTLQQRLARSGRQSVAHAVWHARQAAEALVALHEADWTHGDVKPANMLVGPDGHLTLIDLGFARPIGERQTGLSRALAATPNYMAPEVASGAAGADPGSDWYSLGVTLYELVTGELPFGVERTVTRSGVAKRMRQLNPLATARLAQLVEDLVANDPLRRPQGTEAVERLVAVEIEAIADRIAC
jgi:serine/threonine protein kinase